MGSKINRTGEENINSFGSEMMIIKYRNAKDIDVYFPEYDWIAKNRIYGNFKKGKISCPYEKNVYKVGYLGEGDYKVKENGKITRYYETWHGMLRRCYDEKYHKKHPTYKDCVASEKFHNFQNFSEWDDENYYEIEGERMCLDKDILFKHNKIYSPETCLYVPQIINNLFVKSDSKRGNNPIGVSLRGNEYRTECQIFNPETRKSKKEYLGYYDTQEKAFEVYKYYKEKNIKQMADYFKGQIPDKLYRALYNYEVEITD